MDTNFKGLHKTLQQGIKIKKEPLLKSIQEPRRWARHQIDLTKLPTWATNLLDDSCEIKWILTCIDCCTKEGFSWLVSSKEMDEVCEVCFR